MSQLAFDDETAKQLEVLYATSDVLRRRRLVRAALAAQPGERILDVGCGPGFYVAELLDQVGPDGSVVGVDASPQMIAVAQQRTKGRDNVEFHQADAVALPVGDDEFDAAVSVQVLEYVADATKALTEMHRVLRPGGRVVVWDVDWSTLSWHSNDPDRMERILRAWDTHLTHRSLPRTLATRLREAGFDGVEAVGHTFATTELTQDAYGGAIFPLIEQFVADQIGADETSAWAAEQRQLGERGEFFFACIQFCFTATKKG
jgi:ubiquinone/menaquinone biosynthesis C-methylase UbiE